MSEKLKPSKAETGYGQKNSNGDTYDELEKALRTEALTLKEEHQAAGLPDKGESTEYFEKMAHDNAQAELDEFRVKDPELAEAMADAEDRERTAAAATRLINNGIQSYSFEKLRTSEPGTYDGLTEKVNYADQRKLVDLANAETNMGSSTARAMREVSQAARQKEYGNSTPPPVQAFDAITRKREEAIHNTKITLPHLAVETRPIARKHDKLAEKEGEKAAQDFLRQSAE